MTSELSTVACYPPELLSNICAYIYAASLPPAASSLDPILHSEEGVPTSLPSSFPSPTWPDGSARKALTSLCLTNKAWYDAAKPWLWRKVEVRLPRSWLSVVEEVAGVEDGEADEAQAMKFIGQTIQSAESAALAAKHMLGNETAAMELHKKLLESLSGPDGSIPPELLTPPASREPSPKRTQHKSKSPARWKLVRSISVAMQNVMERDEPGIYVPSPHDPRPGRFIRHLDFNHFRTIGMRRSIEEGVNNRFVTGDRLVSVLKEMPNLSVFGATEYMDGALTFPVLSELLLRGSAARGAGHPSRGRDVVVFDPIEKEDGDRRRECKELEAIDLTGCVSAVFVNALIEFVHTHFGDQITQKSEESRKSRTELQRGHIARSESLTFPGLKRLGLRGVRSVQANILQPLVLAFPSLTHLDLSCTRITADLLDALATSTTIHLQSLALERCNMLTGESIRNFLINAPAAVDLKELSLYGDFTFPSPLSEEDLSQIFTLAPCFKSGELEYLDLSSAPITGALLLDLCAALPKLRSLGLSYIRRLELSAIAQFLKTKAPKVEVLTLVMTSPDLGYGEQYVAARQATVALHAHLIRPLCTLPFSAGLTSPGKSVRVEPPTRLRVIELATSLLASLGAGAGSWRIIKSKGGRGWYVDSASGWIAEPSRAPAVAGKDQDESVLRRDLPSDHPWRRELERLADANGNVSSGIGWHARKMEVLHGHGLLGRDAGLYGAVSFAYQG